MAETRKKRPRDPIAPAKLIGDIANGQIEDREQDARNQAAVDLGRMGGKKSGRTPTNNLSPMFRAQIAANSARPLA